MTENLNKKNNHPLIQMVMNIFYKFTQTPDIYPIKHYRKTKNIRRF